MINRVIDEFKSRRGNYICEIGCRFTLDFARSGGYVWSIDLAREAVREAALDTQEYKDCHVMIDDGVSFVTRWPIEIDLLCVNPDVGDLVYDAAKSTGKLPKKALIYLPSGKLIQQAIDDGFNILFDNEGVLLG